MLCDKEHKIHLKLAEQMNIVPFLQLKAFKANVLLVLWKYISSKLILVENGIYKIMGFKTAKITALYKSNGAVFLISALQ